MTNLLAVSYQAMNLLRRELEDVLEQLPIPFRMRREAEELIDVAPSPAWLWRAIDQMLEDYMPPAGVRRRIERVFDRAFTTFRGGYAGDGYNGGGRFDAFGRGYGNGALRQTADWFGRASANDGWSRSFDGRHGNYGTFAGQNAFWPTNGAFFTNGQLSTNGLLPTSSFFPTNVGLPTNGHLSNGGFFPTSSFFSMNGSFPTNGSFATNPFFPMNGGFPTGANNAIFSTNDHGIPVEVVEREHDIIVRAEIPAREHDVDTRITDNLLTIRAQLVTGNFVTRTIPLPRNVDVTRVQAIFHRGLLEVCVSKFDSTRVHRVPVQRETGFRTNPVGDVRSYVS